MLNGRVIRQGLEREFDVRDIAMFATRSKQRERDGGREGGREGMKEREFGDS